VVGLPYSSTGIPPLFDELAVYNPICAPVDITKHYQLVYPESAKKRLMQLLTEAGNRMCTTRSFAFVFGLTIGLLAIAANGILCPLAHAATWTGSAGSTDWVTGANWGGTAPLSGDSLIFTSANASPSATLTDTLTSSAFNIAGITFNAGSVPYTFTGNTFVLTGNVANNSTSLETINNPFSMTAARTFTMTSGGGNITLGGVISGTGGGISTAGTGTLTLSGANTYTGSTTVNANTLNIGSNSALGTGTLVINNAGAILDATGGDRTLTNSITMSNSWAFTGTNNLTLGAVPAFAADRTIALNSTTGKTLTLGTITNSSNASRSLTVNGVGNKLILGGLQLAPNTATAARVFTIDGSGTVEITGPVTNGTAGFNHEMRSFGSGTLILSGASTYAGTTRAISGTLQLTGSLNSATYLRIGQSGAASGKFILGGASNAVNQTVSRLDVPQVNSTTNPHNNMLVGGNAVTSILTVNSTTSDTFDAMIGGTGTNENNIGITKAGSGVLTLSNTAATGGPYNSYNGPTTVQAGGLVIQGQQTGTGATSITGGTLTVSGTGSINGSSGVTINGSGAKLLYTSTSAMTGTIPIALTLGTIDGTGTIGATTVANDASNIINHGNGGSGALGLSSLTFSGAATVNLKANAVGLAVTNGLSTNGTNTVALNLTHTGSVSTGFLDLISFGSYTGSLSDFNVNTTDVADDLNTRQSLGGLALDGNNIALQIIGDTVRWTGLDNNNWATGLTGTNKNWHLVNANSPTDYIDGDGVLFNDSGTNTALDLGTNVAPGNMSFNNSTATPYSISSTGGNSISGTGSLTKSGTGSLTVNTPAAYTSGTVFNGGSLILGNAVAGLGNGTFTIGTGSAKTLDNTSGGSITLGTTTQTWNDDFTFTGSNDLNMGTGNVTLSGAIRTITVNGSTLTVGGLQGGTTTALIVNGAGTLGVGNSTVAGLDGTGTIANNLAANATLTDNQNTDVIFGGRLVDGAFNNLSLTKQGTAKLTLTNTNSYSGTTTLNVGTLVAANTAALGNTARLNILGNGTTFIFATDADTASPLPIGLASNVTTNIVSDRATPGAAVDRTMTVNNGQGLGGGTINFTQGTNVTSGTGRITFSQLGLGAGGSGTLTLNPTGVNLSVGNVSKFNNNASEGLELSGSTSSNEVTGIISNGIVLTGSNNVSLIKSGTSTWTISADNTYTGTTVINAGTLIVGNGGGSGKFGTGTVTNNGTLSYNRSDTALIETHAISGTGSVNQIGSGQTTFTGTNTYTGPTTITGGTMALGGTGAINNSSGIAINGSGAKFLHIGTVASTPAITLTQGTLDGTSTVGATTVADLATNTVANGNGGIGTLTLSALTFGGDATANIIRAGSVSPLAVTNALTTTPANGQVTINGSGTWNSGLNNLISYGSYNGVNASAFTLGSVTGLTSRQIAGSLSLNGNNVALNIIGDIVKWTGLDDGNWAAGLSGTNKNWKVTSGPTDYLEGDEVMFDDSVTTGTTAIDLGSNVSPGSTTFNNTTKNYTLGSVGGNGILTNSLIKSGTGSLSINTANSYNLGTTFNGGTLNLGNAAALGTGALTIATGNAKTLNNTNGGALLLSNGIAQNWNDNFSFAGSNDLDMGSGAVTVGGSGDRTVTVSAGTLTVGELRSTSQNFLKQGAGTLVLTSVGTNGANDGTIIAGKLTVGAGTIQINRTGAAAVDSGDLTVSDLAGTGTITNGAASTRAIYVNTSSSTNSVFDGSLANGGSTQLDLYKQGDGTLKLTNASTYTGTTQIQGGTLVMAHGQALGDATTGNTIIRFNSTTGGALDIATDGVSDSAYRVFMNSNTNATIVSNRATPGPGINHPLSTSNDNNLDGFGGEGAGGNGVVTFMSGSNVTSGTGSITFDHFNLGSGGNAITHLNPTTARVTIGSVAKNKNSSNQTLDLGGTIIGNQITGTISDILPSATNVAVVSISKSSSSTWTLSGNSTYTGTTTINGGTLLVNGNNSAATGAVTVGAAGILGGTGTIGGIITNDGTISPGNSVGTLTASGNVTMDAASHYLVELSGANADKLVIGGNIDLSAPNNFLDVTGTGSGSSWQIGSYVGTLTGTFENITTGYTVDYGTGTNSVITLNFTGLPGDLNNDGHVDAGDYVYWRKNGLPQSQYDAWRANFGNPPGSGSSLGATSVPEPTTLLLVPIAAIVFLVASRRRAKTEFAPAHNRPM
jgi:fibronectin-binding autotransporter adhesin